MSFGKLLKKFQAEQKNINSLVINHTFAVRTEKEVNCCFAMPGEVPPETKKEETKFPTYRDPFDPYYVVSK